MNLAIRFRLLVAFALALFIATSNLLAQSTNPGKFFEKHYPLPADMLAVTTNGRVIIKFASKVWGAGGVYDVRLMRPNAPGAP